MLFYLMIAVHIIGQPLVIWRMGLRNQKMRLMHSISNSSHVIAVIIPMQVKRVDCQFAV
jgi:hypothetical protein